MMLLKSRECAEREGFTIEVKILRQAVTSPQAKHIYLSPTQTRPFLTVINVII
jgi:hypothetical protein